MRARRGLGVSAALLSWLLLCTVCGCDGQGGASPFRSLGKRGDGDPSGARPAAR